MRTEELNIQIAVVNYLRLQYPLALYCASAGGVRTSMTQAKKMKATGYKKGFPDLFIYEPRGSYHGLAIELKTNKGRLSESQAIWITRLATRGYMARICKGFDEAKNSIDQYFKL